MNVAATVISAAILAFAAAFHLYWGFGGRLGHSVAIPHREDGRPVGDPGAHATIAVGVLLLGMLIVVVGYAGVIPLPVPKSWQRAAVALFALIFTARALSWHKYAGLFKQVRDTRFGRYDTWMYSPLCLVLGLCLLFLAALPR